MAIDVQGGAHLGVPQSLLDYLGMDPLALPTLTARRREGRSGIPPESLATVQRPATWSQAERRETLRTPGQERVATPLAAGVSCRCGELETLHQPAGPPSPPPGNETRLRCPFLDFDYCTVFLC